MARQNQPKEIEHLCKFIYCIGPMPSLVNVLKLHFSFGENFYVTQTQSGVAQDSNKNFPELNQRVGNIKYQLNNHF